MSVRVVAVVLCAAVLSAACSGAPDPRASGSGAGSPTPTLEPPPIDLSKVPARVHVEAPRATAAWVGSAAASLTATAEDGTTYRLDLPDGAVPARTAITMTPIASIDDLGLTGGLAGGVYLQPAGLQLAATATLTITTGRTVPDGLRLAAFDIGDDGATTGLIPVAAGDGSIAVAVDHFSAPGAGFGTTADLALMSTAPSGSLAQVMTELLAYDVLWAGTDKLTAKLKLIQAWAGVMDPELVAAVDDARLVHALADWRQFVFLLNLYDRDGNAALAVQDGLAYEGPLRDADLASFYRTGQIKLGQRIVEAINANKALCEQTHDLNALANMAFWARAGERHHPLYTDWLQQATGCAQVVLPVVNLPTNLAAGGADSANLQFALEFTDGTQVVEAFEVQLSGNGFVFANGQTSAVVAQAAQASVTEATTASQDPPYTLSASACWIRDGLVQRLCSVTFTHTFGTGSSVPTPAATLPPATGQIPDLSGAYTVFATCNRVQYGTGTGTVTQSGASLTMSWSITLSPDRDTAVRDSLCWAPFIREQFVTSGSFSGTLTHASGAWVVELSSVSADPCTRVDPVPPTTVGVGLRWQLPSGYCMPPGTPVQYQASRAGP